MAFGGFGQANASANDTPIEASTPWVAASDGNLDLMQRALSTLHIAPSTAADDNGYTLVHAAAAYNQTRVLEWLMAQEGVNGNVQDNDGDSPLHHVEHVDAARLLVERMNANPNIVNGEQKTALQARMEDLHEQMDDDNEDEDDNLKALVDYLKTVTLTGNQQ